MMMSLLEYVHIQGTSIDFVNLGMVIITDGYTEKDLLLRSRCASGKSFPGNFHDILILCQMQFYLEKKPMNLIKCEIQSNLLHYASDISLSLLKF